MNIKVSGRNVYNEDTMNFLENFVDDLKELLNLYEIKKIHGWDDGSIVLTMEDGTEHNIETEEAQSVF